MKNYVALVNDHSVSMQSIASAALKDVNTMIRTIKTSSKNTNIPTSATVVQFGINLNNTTHDSLFRRPSFNSGISRVGSKIHVDGVDINSFNELMSYPATGSGTPLYDGIGLAIETLQKKNDNDAAYLVVITTDGQENVSQTYSARSITDLMNKLQATDRWTFVFRVPRGARRSIENMGVPAGNIQEWDQTERGYAEVEQKTSGGIVNYYAARSAGATKSTSFYTDLSKVSTAEVKAKLTDISAEVSIWPVLPNEDGAEIRPFVEKRLGHGMLKGGAFYQLVTVVPIVQDYKMIIIREKSTGYVYSGAAARQLLKLPTSGNCRVRPGDHGNYDIFIQSTSVNRKLFAGTQVLYWPKVGTSFSEGPSSAPFMKDNSVYTKPITIDTLPVAAYNAPSAGIPKPLTAAKIMPARDAKGRFLARV